MKQEFFNIDIDFNAETTKYSTALEQLRQKIVSKAPYYKVLSPQNIDDFITPYENLSQELSSNFDDLIIVSMGGANLNPASLVSAARSTNSNIRLHFLFRTEESDFLDILNQISLEKTAILTISKSGGTLETIAICASLIEQFKQAGIADLAKHFYFLSKKEGCKIAELANELGSRIIEHDQEVGGRYSGLDNVSILPALTAGIDVRSYLRGAYRMLEAFIQSNDHPAIHSAIAFLRMDRSILTNIAYSSSLTIFLKWTAQIIAESLGKQGKGYTPLVSMGPEDQHSMFQLYLDGPDDKFYSYYSITESQESLVQLANMPVQIGKVSGMDLEQIHKINENASFTALKKINRPLRKITMKDRSAEAIGELVAFSMLEVVVLGTLMGINPFDQDGVELIKRESRAAVE